MHDLVVSGLEKSFVPGFARYRKRVIHGIDFKVTQGGVTGFVGANGSGKTTTIKCLLRLIKADKGDIKIFGEPDFSENVKKRIGFLPEHPHFPAFLTAYEFLWLHAKLSLLTGPRPRILEVLERVGLLESKDLLIRNFSKGMMQRLGLAQAILHKPDLLILDEPLSGLDPEGRVVFKKIIREQSQRGATVFFSSHLLFDVHELCRNLVVIEKGKTVFDGPIDQLIQQSDRFVVEYRQGTLEPQQEVITGPELQGKIDQLRRSQSEILKIEQMTTSLETAVRNLNGQPNL